GSSLPPEYCSRPLWSGQAAPEQVPRIGRDAGHLMTYRRTGLEVNTAVLVFPALVFQVLLGAVLAYAFLPAGLLLCQSPRSDPLLQKTFPQCFLHRPSYRRAFCIHRCSTSLSPPETLLLDLRG